jgi:hypothetical protein
MEEKLKIKEQKVKLQIKMQNREYKNGGEEKCRQVSSVKAF